ncbi:hypothetical protein LOTGIDRAFT_234283 [Lottia gigantea]|uniref:Uncharacterized protein n=1 Tax=Lottia gigantea TaxID=225164 RepID=V4A3D3_LOTGI|nr:hypothetical protein LOTGIDRAFT_234283 [Lottia gigantea]ESO89430.1 hypothetical protein LOTGIDRAFT_234283 [Lottia gigantea]
MSFSHIPPSPNWYCSKVSDVNTTGLYVFGARSNVYIFKTNGGNHGPPHFVGMFTEHKDRVSSTMLGQTKENHGSCCSTSDDGFVKVWDIASKVTTKSHSEHKDKITCGSWSSLQDDLIVTGDERGNIICWQYKADICQKFKQEKEYIFSIACSPHKKFHVAVGYKSGNVLLLDITKNCRVLHKLRGHDDEIHCIVWCPVPGETIFTDGEQDEKDDAAKTGCIVATGSRDRTIKFWSSEKGRQLFQKKLPINTGYKREQREEGRNKVWLTLYWRKEKWHQLISSSHGGELILWDILPSAEKPMQLFSSTEGRGHTRVVFNICASSKDENHLYTISMDRLIGVWSLKTMSCINTLPSLGGYLYTIKSSPVDPGRLALGVGDSMIRVWNTNNKTNSFDFQSLWQGIKSKVTCLSWHPSKESWLAYGTDDGRVGIYDVFSQKPPLLSGTFHRKTVYVVAWGPPSKCTEENFSNFSLYTVGDGVILEHHPKVMSKEATNINKIIESANGKKTPGSHLIRSDISWKPDYSLVAIGNEDGSVDVYWADFKLRCVIQVHRKLINCLQWHPHITTQGGSIVSTCNSWLASGANDAMVHIVDLSDIPVDKPVTIIESMRKLEGHSIRVTGLSWSPHVDGKIASCGYDSSVIVWNVKTGTALVKFDGHQGRILSVLWSGLDPDEIISGGFDCSLHRWKISSLPKALLEFGMVFLLFLTPDTTFHHEIHPHMFDMYPPHVKSSLAATNYCQTLAAKLLC